MALDIKYMITWFFALIYIVYDREWLYNYVHTCGYVLMYMFVIFSATVRVQPHGPAARNIPGILRRDPDMPPSFVDQDCAFENTTG